MKKFLKSIIFISLLSVMIVSLVACGSKNAGKPNDTTSVPCEHTYEESIQSPAMPLKDGVKLFTCSKCQDNYTEAIPMTKSLKILAIGNSFSSDAVEYLWDMCNQGGVETVIVGNLYIGGCTLETHDQNLKSNKAAYTYYKNTDGGWKSAANTKPMNVLSEEDWDVVTIQQASRLSGNPSSLSTMQSVIDSVLSKCPNAKIYWHMTWAYPANSTETAFSDFNKDQLTMYKAIVNTVKNRVLKNNNVCGVIPVGTAIQNIRTSYLGDTLNRDASHLNYNFGRYTAAMTWYAYFTGADVDTMEWIPKVIETKMKGKLNIVKEAVKNAIEKPYEVTNSIFTERP